MKRLRPSRRARAAWGFTAALIALAIASWPQNALSTAVSGAANGELAVVRDRGYHEGAAIFVVRPDGRGGGVNIRASGWRRFPRRR
jgi:hypothetical protein